MSARILSFMVGAPTIPPTHTAILPSNGPIRIEVPSELTKRVTDAALWAGKSPEQFILDMLHAAFPDGGGAA